MPPTFVESVVASHAVGGSRSRVPEPGDVVWLRPDRLMTHDNTSAVLARFLSMGATRVADPSRCVIVLDHDVQNTSPANRSKYAAIETFAQEQRIEFHAAGTGIGHQVMIERGHVRPGALCVAADSHANTYGALGALGVGVTRSDAAAIWASGMFWWEVPESVRVVFEGHLPPGATGKDVALVLCAVYPNDVLGTAVEFCGPGVHALGRDDRLTLSNMTTEWGAVAGAFPPEGVGPVPTGASYAATITLDLSLVSPHVAGPDTLDRAVPVASLQGEKIAIQKAYLVSCANGRLADLEAAASVLRGRRVAAGVSLYVAPASAAVQAGAEASGAWRALLDAGAIPLLAGCGPCIGLGAGLLEPGETGISASNRNFKGRMGSSQARCYLASPAIVAASAVAGFICGATGVGADASVRFVTHHALSRGPRNETVTAEAGRITGRMVAFFRDGIDTDALCPARFVYADGTSQDELKDAVFGAIDPSFAGRVRPGDVLLTGARFGSGSSREQAVTALTAAGIRAVVAESLAPAFRRNAWNNGFPALERPDLVRSIRARLGESSGAAVFTNEEITIELGWLPSVARDLIASGGLDAVVRLRSGHDHA